MKCTFLNLYVASPALAGAMSLACPGQAVAQGEPATGSLLRPDACPYELVAGRLHHRQHAQRTGGSLQVRDGRADQAPGRLHGARSPARSTSRA